MSTRDDFLKTSAFFKGACFFGSSQDDVQNNGLLELISLRPTKRSTRDSSRE